MIAVGRRFSTSLRQEKGVHLSVPKIYEILAEKYVIRSKWKKNKQRGQIPTAIEPREVIQMDTIDFGGLFAFTAIDIFTKEADILLAPELTARVWLSVSLPEYEKEIWWSCASSSDRWWA